MSFPEYIVKLVDDIAKHEHFIDYSIESSDATKRGENFTGKLTFLQLAGRRNENPAPDKIQLVLKTVPSNRNQRLVFQAVTGFKCEVEMYTKVLPKFIAFQDEKRITTDEKLLTLPNVYATVFDEENDHFAIVMEDLRAKNYKKFSRSSNMTSMTYDHARLVMAKLAQFHAISFAMKDQNLGVFNEIVRSGTLSSKFMKDDLGYEILNIFEHSLNALENAKHKELIDDLKTTYLEWVDKFSNEQFVGGSGVLLHGDCQTNNVLFQHKANENPIDAMLIDWQMSRFGPPIIDLLYFILSTTDKSFRDQHFTNLLNEYHSLLSTSIEQLGSDASIVYPKSTFDSDLIKFNRFALIFACVSVTFRFADERHILDLDEYAERICKGERPKLILEFDADTEILYRKALNDTVADVVQYCGIN
ncbi:uncharacterized protein LOC119069172 [Bradysia coprophila]|uniref:uncharacterized protein LOC119069172 n=1 Tax=Bradysia coprophila TaxID=38358 RepID=UPI00187DC16D|nr:uncharacterized protein LOC119069172 [Bradysia coprophila]